MSAKIVCFRCSFSVLRHGIYLKIVRCRNTEKSVLERYIFAKCFPVAKASQQTNKARDMESGIKQNAVSFSAGMSNVPNNVLCGDDACSEVVGLTSENGEMKPIQKAVKVFDVPASGDRLLYVHQLQTGKVYVYMAPSVIPSSGVGYYITVKYRRSGSATVRTINVMTEQNIDLDSISITSIGNTLILKSNLSIEYFLWNGDGYQNLGGKIPELDVKFWLGDGFDLEEKSRVSDSVLYRQNNVWDISVDQNENWNNFVIGEFSTLQNKVRKANGFFSPFFALAALELYDGSYYMATAPVALYPNIDTRFWGSIESTGSPIIVTTRMKGQHLMFTQNTDYANWADIVKNVVIFVTDGVSPCDTTSDAVIDYIGQFNGEKASTGFFGEDGTRYDFNLETIILPNSTSSTVGEIYQLLLKKTEANVIREMAELRVFYRLCEIGTSAMSSAANTKDYISAHTLENLTTQMRLDVDGGEYFDHTMKFGQSVYSYNGRLHMANIRRNFFGGFKQFISKKNDDNTTNTHTVRVAIETPQGVKVVMTTGVIGSVGHYFYYPDPRAKYVEIDSTIVKKLEEHKGLNGSYCIVSPLETLSSDSGIVFPTETFNGSYELLPNKVLVSEVDNPFVFRARGYNTVGKGEVMAIVSNTVALSDGQFGQFPLYAFATDGIWALGTNSTGTYSTVAPMSREVCNNADSVTQTDSAVFFTSAKGLMVLSGSRVQCVSEQLNGKTETWGCTTDIVDFKDFLQGCSIAYDYRDSLLWVFNANGDYDWHYVYNMKSGTWAKMLDGAAWQHEVSDYPDTLLQNEDGEVFSLLQKPDQNTDTAQYAAHITTRPMKFGNAMALKSLRQMKHLKDMESRAELGVEIWAGNDCRQWVHLPSLRGQGWKYYRLKYTFGKLAATDRFIGSVFVTQERETEKLR
jgi:hypothetical protein